jgi:hypothetical protein
MYDGFAVPASVTTSFEIIPLPKALLDPVVEKPVASMARSTVSSAASSKAMDTTLPVKPLSTPASSTTLFEFTKRVLHSKSEWNVLENGFLDLFFISEI